MSYADWDLDEKIRTEDTFENLERVNQKYISGNPFLKDFFNDLRNKKNNNALIFDKILDIGCGWGSSSILLSDLFEKVHAIDISTTSVSKAKKNIELEEFDAENLNIRNTYDFIYSWGVIHHSVNPSKIYKNMFNSLKENGSFMIMVYNRNSPVFWLKGLYQLFIKLKILKGYNIETVQKFCTDGYFQKHYVPKKLIDELKLLGFRSLKYELSHVDKSFAPFFKKNSNLDNFFKKFFGAFLIIHGIK